MSIIAIYDLGSNAFKLIIAEKTNTTFNIIYKTEAPVKLASKGINNKYITDEAKQRAYNALEMFNNISIRYKVEKTICIGTSALRDATNSKQILSEIYNKFNLQIEIINGQKEAELIYNGVKHAYNFNNENVLILDIGGGSVEIIIANQDKVHFQHSFNIGIRRVYEKLNITDPITQNQISKIENYYSKELKLLDTKISKLDVKTLIGTSGSFKTINNLITHNFSNEQKQVGKASYTISKYEFEELCNKIIPLPADKRAKIEGMDINRVDLVSMALVFVNYFIKKYKFVNIVYSEYSLKEGVLHKTIL